MLFHKFDLARPPLFCEERFERAVETEYRVPAFAWDRLDPVAALETVGLVGTEVNCRGAVDIRLWRRVMDSFGCPRAGSAGRSAASSGSGCRIASATRTWQRGCSVGGSSCRSCCH